MPNLRRTACGDTLCPFASAPQRPAQASALALGCRLRARLTRRAAQRRDGVDDGREAATLEAGSIRFSLRDRFTRRFLRASSSEVPIRANSSLSYFRVIHATDAKPPHRGRYGEEDGGCGNGKRLPPATRHRRASRALAALARPRGTRGLPAATRAHAPHRSRGVAK